MGLQKPIENALTDEQSKVLAQLSSMKNVFSLKLPKRTSIDPSKQISTFDYTRKLTEATLGIATMDIFLKMFLDRLFDPNNDKLERIILKAIAKSLNDSGKKLSDSQTNQQWLLENCLGPLNAVFRIAKAQIVKQILTLIFGPKEKMSSDPVQQTRFLESAVCSSDMFSVSNPTSDSDGDLEYNKVELRKRLEKGEMIFVISCQDVKIKLPETILAQADNIIANNSNPDKPKINPSVLFEQTSNHVTSETQRINAPENANAVRKSFMQILVEKIINLITIAMEPHIGGVFSQMNQSPNGNQGFSYASMTPSPCEIRSLCVANDEEFKSKTSFMSAMMNGVYAFLLSVLIQRLIKELKAMIKKYIIQKAQDRLRRKLTKRKFGNDIALQKVEKAAKFAEATKKFDDIFKFGET